MIVVLSPSWNRFMAEAEDKFGGQISKVERGRNRITLKDGTEYQFICNSDPDRLRGLRDVKVEFWGPLPQHLDYNEIKWLARIAEMP
jgi:hypothetical protein